MDIVLVTTDNDLSASLVGSISGWGYRVNVARSSDAALKILQRSGAPVLAIIDERIDKMTGLDMIRCLRRRSGAPYQYLILLGESEEKEDILLSLHFGADEYIAKPIDVLILKMQLHVARRIMSQQIRAQLVQEELWNQANMDLLTGIPNRRAVLKNLERSAMLCSQCEQPIGILMIDLDHFKMINDNFGHDGGDLVLKEASKRMQSCIRTSDTIGRFGGEEFLAIIPNGAVKELLRVAERIREAIANEPVVTDDFVIPVTCSIGIAVRWDNTDGTIEETIQRADKALYVAKEMGRNKVVSAWSLHNRSRLSV